MNARTKRIGLFKLIAIAGLLVAIAACENPFAVGFGDSVDIEKPDGDLESPDAGQYLRATVTLTGVYSDDSAGTPTVQVSFDDGATLHSATVSAGEWTYVLDTTTLPDGEIEILIIITDASGKQTEKRQLYYVDNSAPLVLVKNPQGYASSSYNGDVTVRGEVADLYAIDSVRVQIQDDTGSGLTGFELADGTNSWVYTFDSRIYADPAGDLRLAVQATDRAGNVSTTVVHYDDILSENGNFAITVENLLRIANGETVGGATITQSDIINDSAGTPPGVRTDSVPVSIDNDLDKPTVTIVSPANAQSVGGSVLVTGTAFDDDGLDHVEMRIDLNGDGDYLDAINLNPGTDSDTDDEFEDESQWVTLSGTVVWAKEINANGELYETEPGHEGQITIQVRAVDNQAPPDGPVVGNTSEISIVLDDSIPRVEGLLVDGQLYTNGISVSGTNVVIETDNTQTLPPDYDGGIRDDTQVDVVRISYDGGVGYTDVFRRDTATNDGSIIETAPNDLRFSKTIDTTNIPGIGAITSGPLYMRLLIFDNNDPVPYQTFAYITLNVDNVYPSGTWTVPLNPVTGDVDVEGTALVQGSSTDTGVVSGIDRVEVYFVRGGQVYDLSASNTTVGVASADFYDGDLDDAVKPFDYTPANGANNNPPYYHIAIDNELEFGDDASGGGDDDTFDEDLSISGPNTNWSATFDSTGIPDGPIELHYVVFDEADNGTHYQLDAFVKNSEPSISGITVGTDLDRDGTVEPGEQFAYSSSFVGRDLVYVDIAATDPLDPWGAGGIASWQVFRDNGDPATDPELSPVSGAFETGGSFEIGPAAAAHSIADEDTTVDYYVKVTDTVGITTTFPFSVTIDNDDASDSTIVLDAITDSSVVDGYVESALQSFYENGTGADADVSGTIAITGRAEDNQRIQFIYLTIEDYDVGAGVGVQTQVAHWDAGSGQLVSDVAEFTITSQTIDTTKHEVYYSYEWNTAGGLARAALDIDISVESEDFGSATTNDVESTVVDIVPYISAVSTDTSGVRDRNIRSAQGYYTIGASDSGADLITIHGYNLQPITNGVRVSPDTDGLVGTTLQGETLTIDTVAGDFKSVTVRKNATGSGYLAVVGGTVGVPIPSINNINDDLPQNQEPSVVQANPNLDDNRYLTFFQTVNTGFVNGYYPEMIMNGDFPTFGFIDDSGANDLQFSRGEVTGEVGTTATASTIGLIRGLGFQYYGLAQDDDGIYHQISSSTFNSMSQYYIYGEYASDYPGPCGGGRTDNCGATTVYWSGYTGNRAQNAGNDALLMDSLSYTPGLLVGRYKNPRMVASGSSTTPGTAATVGMAFFDQAAGEIIYRNFQVGQAPGGGTNITFADTGGTNMTDLNGTTTGDATRNTVTSSASQYFDMGLTDNDEIVIAYYDEGSGQLNLIYSSTAAGNTTPASVDGANPTAAVTFSAPTAVSNLFIGSYVSMAIENDGSGATPDPIHIAAHDSSGADLAYIRFDSLTDTNPEVVIVDANLSVGIWTDIAVNASGVPYIGYYNNSETGSRDSVKLAYFLGDAATLVTPGVDGSDEVTGNWEFLTIPSIGTPNGGISQFTRVSIGFDASGDPVVGYLADDIEYSRELPPL